MMHRKEHGEESLVHGTDWKQNYYEPTKLLRKIYFLRKHEPLLQKPKIMVRLPNFF